MAGFASVNTRVVDPVLTQWMVVQGNDDSAYIADLAFAPNYREGRSTGTFFRADTDLKSFGNTQVTRAKGGPFHRGSLNLTNATYQTLPYGFEIPIDDDLARESQTPMQLEQLATLRAEAEVKIRREMRCAATMFVTGAWTNEATLGAAAQWDDAGGDPLGNLWTAKRAVKLASGKDVNTAIMGWDSFRVAVQNGDLVSLMPADTRTAQLTLSGLANRLREAFEIDRLYIGKAIRNTANEGIAEVNAFVWTDNMWLGHIPASGPEGPAFAQFASTSGGAPTVVDRYREEAITSDIVRVRENRDEVVVDADAGYLIINIAN